MGEKPITTLPTFEPASAKQRGFKHTLDLDGDGQISRGDLISVPLKPAGAKKTEMVTLVYDEKTQGPLLAEFFQRDPSECGETAIEIPTGTGKAYAEWATDKKGRFAYFTTLRFGDKDVVIKKAEKVLSKK